MLLLKRVQYCLIFIFCVAPLFAQKGDQNHRLNLDEKSYTFDTKIILGEMFEMNISSRLDIEKLDNGNYRVDEKLDKMDLFSKRPVFSFNALMEPFRERFYLQHFLMNTVFSKEITPEGNIVWQSKIDSLVNQPFYQNKIDGKFWDAMSSFLDYSPDRNFMARTFVVDDEFQDKVKIKVPTGREDNYEGEKLTKYRVAAIDEEQTSLLFQGNLSISTVDNSSMQESYASEGVLIIDNNSGLPFYFIEFIEVNGKDFIVEQKQEECSLSVDTYRRMKFYGGGNFEETNWNVIDDIDKSEDYYPTKRDALKALNKMKIKGEIGPNISPGNTDIHLMATVKPIFSTILVKDVECEYCNHDVVSLGGCENAKLYIGGFQDYPNEFSVFHGTDFDVFKLTIDMVAQGYYGKKERILSKRDEGEVIATFAGDFFIDKWHSKSIVCSHLFGRKLFDIDGNPIKKYAIKPAFPQYKYASQLLDIPVDSVSSVQAFIYGCVLGKYRNYSFLQIKTEKEIGRFDLIYSTGMVEVEKSIVVRNPRFFESSEEDDDEN